MAQRGERRRLEPAGVARGSFRDHALRPRLLAVYTEVDRLFGAVGCAGTTECCRFGLTGREPYPTAIERAELVLAVRARGGPPRRRSLPVAGEAPCPLLTDEGRCSVYAARPFGCRTFFCDRVHGVLPDRREIRSLSQELVTLSEAYEPGAPDARALRRALADAKMV